MPDTEPAGTEPQAQPKRPTIRDVAALAGVSKSVASRVFSGSTHVSESSRDTVERAAATLGYRPNWVARSLAGERDDFVGILVADLHNPVFAEVVDAARAELSTFGKVGLLTSAMMPKAFGREGESVDAELDAHALALFGDLRPSRILIVGSIPNAERLLEASPTVRVVTASAVPVGLPDALSVRGDDDEGMRLVIDHLIERGHRRIAHIGGAGGPVSVLRVDAYRRLMLERGLEAFIRIEPSDYTQASGHAAAELLLADGEPPTAITAANDLVAIGALVAAQAHFETTRIRVAVTGYDDTFLAALPQIALTTVDPDNEGIGRAAARLLMEVGEGPVETLVAPTLVTRASTSSRAGS